jgi:hypothetical protein
MSNRTAIAVALTLMAAVVADMVLNAGDGTRFLLQKLIAAVEWLVFWR